MIAACSRPQRVTPPKSPTSQARLVAAPHAIPVMPTRVTVCGHRPSAAIVQTGVANANTALATITSRVRRAVARARPSKSTDRAVRSAAVTAAGRRVMVSDPTRA